MTEEMNVAMIGGGFMGKAHAMAYAAMPMFFWPAPAIPHRKVVVDVTDDAAETARANALPVRVLGFAGSAAGTAAFNRDLARTRAQAVMDGLVAAGVPASRVSMGDRAAVPFEQMPTEARRVEIVFGS